MTAITHVVPSEVFSGLSKNLEGTTALLRRLLLTRYAQAMVGTPDLLNPLDSEDGKGQAIRMMDISVVPDMPNYFGSTYSPQTEIYIPLAAFDALFGENYVLKHALIQRLLARLSQFPDYKAEKFEMPISDGSRTYRPTGISYDDFSLHIYPVIADKCGGFVRIPDPLNLVPTTWGVFEWLRDDMNIGGVPIEGISTDHQEHVRLSSRYDSLVVASGYDKAHRIHGNGPFQSHIRSQVHGAVQELLALSGLQGGGDSRVRFKTDFQDDSRYCFAP